jgi:hypothetical protein
MVRRRPGVSPRLDGPVIAQFEDSFHLFQLVSTDLTRGVTPPQDVEEGISLPSFDGGLWHTFSMIHPVTHHAAHAFLLFSLAPPKA